MTVGTLAGGLSDAVAVRMLFRPHARRFGFQGAIPKNKARLARSIGRTVGERLLSPADVTEDLARSGVRETFDTKLRELIERLLDTDRASIRELLPAAVAEEIESSLDGLAPLAVEQLTRFVASEDFEGRVRGFVARTRAELASLALGDVLTAERRADIAARAAAWAEDFSQSPDLEAAVRDYLVRRSEDWLGSSTPLLEKVPPAVVRAIESAIDAYLPLAVAKLGSFLHQPASREKIRDALHGLFQRFVDDLRFHERLIARLMVTERTFDKLIDSLETDGVEQVATLLDDPVVRDEITRSIHDAVLTYLRKPLSEVVGTPDSQRGQELVGVVGDSVLKLLRADRTRSFLVARLEQTLERSESRTWGELLAPLDDDLLAGWIAQGARSAKVRDLAQDAVRGAIAKALSRPIGRPGRWLPTDATARLSRVLSPALWEWIETELPGFVERLDIQTLVERKVMAFSTQRVEDLVRGVMQRELNFIIKTGFVLGGLIGVVTFLLTELVAKFR
ncbi:MAG: DUF445 family protein [Gemmatimonadaceae bacterium]